MVKDFLLYGSEHNTLTDEAKRRDMWLFKSNLVFWGILFFYGIYRGLNFQPVPGALEGVVLVTALGTRGKIFTNGWMGWLMIFMLWLTMSAATTYFGTDIYFINDTGQSCFGIFCK